MDIKQLCHRSFAFIKLVTHYQIYTYVVIIYHTFIYNTKAIREFTFFNKNYKYVRKIGMLIDYPV